MQTAMTTENRFEPHRALARVECRGVDSRQAADAQDYPCNSPETT